MPHIRPFRPGDEGALAEVCLRTADAGADATGILADDALWAQVFLLPYLAHSPQLAFVLADERDVPVGYTVAAADTDAFEAWFRQDWWPAHAAGGDGVLAQVELVEYADSRGREPDRYQASGYPAHLHIDLLPQAQGGGWGRRLIAEVTGALRAAGCTGVHLVAGERNTGAAAFYPRVGFHPLPSPDGGRAFGMRLTPTA